ncbi:MAG: DNA-directed RNA polymerase subunit P [Candidatus Asgardarchaeia archaeon]
MANVFSTSREGRVMTYVCYRCGNQVKLNIDMPGQFFRCPYCGSHIFIKVRPPFIKKIKGR